ncbi:membrane protein [Planomonospora alba]|uniref:Membrane protein n=1 Tax=Planomonospora alba TaxID=161354 RepID=A0ABP6NB48_9ACTN
MEEPRHGHTRQASRDHIPDTAPRTRQGADGVRTALPGEEPRSTGRVGWVMFAGIGMMLVGCSQALMGLVGVFNTDFYLVTPDDLAIPVDYTTWGWAHLIMGVVVLLVGAAVMAGRTWGRVVGIVLASLQALVNFAWLPAYPFWSAIVIAVDVLVIHALAVHGGEMKAFGGGGTP